MTTKSIKAAARRSFARRFSLEDWQTLSGSVRFLDVFESDESGIEQWESVAHEILNPPDLHVHRGYWINKPDTFRCYDCGCQYNIHEMNNPPPLENVEVWQGD